MWRSKWPVVSPTRSRCSPRKVMKNAPSLLLVEDEPAIAELLKFTLQGAGYTIRHAVDAASARRMVAEQLPHLVLLDWMLPDGNGIDLLREWRRDARSASLPVIMLTARGQEEDKITGLNEGADDYVTKPFSPKELAARIHALLRRKAPEIGQERLLFGELEVIVDAQQLRIAGRDVPVDHAEFKLLRFLLANPGRAFSRAQLLDKVWGDHAFIEERTVDVHVMRLRKALGDAAAYLQTVRGIGYRLAEPVND